MNELTPARFAELADAYGGTIARWPEAVRAEAIRMATDPTMQAVLAKADALDSRLDGWSIASPGRPLTDHIVASAPRRKRRLRLWWSGIGIATALAGATAGSIAAAATAPPLPSTEDTTVFGTLTEV